ncbi:MAG: hypothetical protein C5B53_05045 [Candidatus Melainabacteria bacterium]|nr:MAG: hypothetical protein C5B53_05045 [Candidatus Melainabacteria bacterium]
MEAKQPDRGRGSPLERSESVQQQAAHLLKGALVDTSFGTMVSLGLEITKLTELFALVASSYLVMLAK